MKSNIKEKWSQCFCGGFIKMVLTHDKLEYMKRKRNHYKKAIWQICNCYPKLPNNIPLNVEIEGRS